MKTKTKQEKEKKQKWRRVCPSNYKKKADFSLKQLMNQMFSSNVMLENSVCSPILWLAVHIPFKGRNPEVFSVLLHFLNKQMKASILFLGVGLLHFVIVHLSRGPGTFIDHPLPSEARDIFEIPDLFWGHKHGAILALAVLTWGTTPDNQKSDLARIHVYKHVCQHVCAI